MVRKHGVVWNVWSVKLGAARRDGEEKREDRLENVISYS
jgi:hypothetical protein